MFISQAEVFHPPHFCCILLLKGKHERKNLSEGQGNRDLVCQLSIRVVWEILVMAPGNLGIVRSSWKLFMNQLHHPWEKVLLGLRTGVKHVPLWVLVQATHSDIEVHFCTILLITQNLLQVIYKEEIIKSCHWAESTKNNFQWNYTQSLGI